MAVIPAITIPDADLPDVLTGVESVWKNDAIALAGTQGFDYTALADRQKLRVCTMAFYRIHARNLRREQAQQAVTVTDVSLS